MHFSAQSVWIFRLCCKVAQSATLRKTAVIQNFTQGSPHVAVARWPQSENDCDGRSISSGYHLNLTTHTTSELKFGHSTSSLCFNSDLNQLPDTDIHNRSYRTAGHGLMCCAKKQSAAMTKASTVRGHFDCFTYEANRKRAECNYCKLEVEVNETRLKLHIFGGMAFSETPFCAWKRPSATGKCYILMHLYFNNWRWYDNTAWK